MNAIAAPPPPISIAREPRADSVDQRIELFDIDWNQYESFAELLRGRDVRLTYDRGVLEFKTVSREHSRLARLIAQLILVLAEELRLPIDPSGDMTMKRQDLLRGIEPDECFYLANAPLVRDRDELDLTVDPPPDLGIEVDVTSDSRNRLPLYAALKVPEVWRFKNETIAFLRLQPDGTFRPVDRSGFFPFLGPADIAPILRDRTATDEETLINRFADWVQTQAQNPPTGQPTA